MNTTATHHTRPFPGGRPTPTAGTVTLVLGLLFSASVAATYVLSLSDVVDPPNWVRAIALVGLPLGLAGVPIAYFFARRTASRDRARVGLGVALVGLVAFVALVIALG
jgi:hypothetical protein